MALRNERGQGSLEYLIIIAAVLAIAAVVVLFLSGAFTSTQASGNVAKCKQQAAACSASLIGVVSTVSCSDVACNLCTATTAVSTNTTKYATALAACKKGAPDFIIAP